MDTYESAGRLATQADAGVGNDTRSFGYDGLHRLKSDTVNTAAGAVVASVGYG
jgi:hypothetical protein